MTQQTSFDVDQVAYFGGFVQSVEAVIASRSVASVCLQLEGSGTCYPVAINILTSTNGFDPVFSIDLSQVQTITPASGQSWSVIATIDVQFQGAKRAVYTQSLGLHSTITVDAPKSGVAKPSSPAGTSTIYIAVIAALAGVVAITAGVVAAVVIKKKCATAAV